MDFRPHTMVVEPAANLRNANIYAGFGADSNVVANPTNDTMWWDEDLIDATVTRQFVLSKLRNDEQAKLFEKVGFGELTDDTYMEWILEKAKRIYLILVDLGVPDQIFGIVDDSWDDDDLPIPLEQVQRLKMTYNKNERLERRFHQRQFMYLLRTLEKGQTTFYDEEEIIPLEIADRRPMGSPNSQVDKVFLPGRPDDVLIRRRVLLGIGENKMTQEDFLSNIEAMRAVQHEHLMSLYAAYIHRDCGYVLMGPLNDSTLKSFLTVTPQSIKILAKQDRRALLFNWLSCLASALAHLHSKGLAHRKIKPSNVMLDVDMNIFLGDCGPFHPSPPPSKSLDKESYDYASPEQWERPSSLSPTTSAFSRSASSSRHGSVFSKASSRDSISTSSSGSSGGSNPMIDFTLFGFAAATNLNDPQKCDIFAMGCIYLEIITFFLKRASRNFASHRSSKNKSVGKAGSDSSFHANLAQVDSWIVTLQKDASKKEDQIFRGIAPVLQVITRMMALDPLDRPTASQVSERLYQIMSQNCKMKDIHCGYELGEGMFAQLGIRERNEKHADPRDADVMSQTTKSSENKSKTSGSRKDEAKAKAKAKAWKAPVYAEFSFG